MHLFKKFIFSFIIILLCLCHSQSFASDSSMDSQMPYICQFNYSGVRYSGGTIASHGCGITSMAMVISYFNGSTYSPTNLTWLPTCQFGLAAQSANLKLTILDEIAPNGNSSRKNRYYNYAYYATNEQKIQIIEALATGCPIINSTWGPQFASGYNGHFFVMSGISGTGSIYVHNPNNKNSSTSLETIDEYTNLAYFIFQRNTALSLNSYRIIYDYDYYTAHNKDVLNWAKTVSNDTSYIKYLVAKHFFTYGIREGRQASPFFNVRDYIDCNSDVANYCKTSTDSNGNVQYDYSKALIHYCQYGYNEGRVAISSHSTIFNPIYYANKYSDLKKAYGNNASKLLNHFLCYGMKEGRQASSQFNLNAYINNYPQFQSIYQNNLAGYYLHFARWGSIAGLKGF